MTPPDKRRPLPGTTRSSPSSPSRPPRTGNNPRPSSPSRLPRAGAPPNRPSAVLGPRIAPPPRAALSGPSSPAPSDHRPPSPAADTALAVQTLLAKDARIAALERELARAESEFARELDARARSEAALRAQVQGLKAWVSASTRMTGGVVTDEEVGRGVRGLGNEVQQWVGVWLRKVKLREEGVGVGRVFVLQGVVGRCLVEGVFGRWFVGVSGGAEERGRAVEGWLGGLGECSRGRWFVLGGGGC